MTAASTATAAAPRSWSRRLVRNRRRAGRWLAAAGGVALVALFLWGWFSAALVAPTPTPLLLDRQGGFLAQIPAADEAGYGYWEVADLPPRVVAATVSLEDRRFWRH